MGLRLDYVRFLLEDEHNSQQALVELHKIKADRASFPRKFHIYRYKLHFF
jgi:hypothetical protein